MTSNWVNFLIPFALFAFYSYKTFYKNQKSLENGILLGMMFVLAVFAVIKLFSFYIRPSF